MTWRKKRGRPAAIVAAILLITGLGSEAFAADILDKAGREVFTRTNQEREAEYTAKLAWDDDLAEAAEIRAQELVQDYNSSHTRPGGAKFYTLSTKVWAENIGRGQESAKKVIGAWLRSPTHRENMLNKDYKIFGAACAEAKDGTRYWVQLFGTGKSNISWTGVTEYTLDPFGDSRVVLKTAEELGSGLSAEGKAGTLVTPKGTVNPDRLALELEKAATADPVDPLLFSVGRAKAVTPEGLQAATSVAEKHSRVILLHADMTGERSGSLFLEPAKLGKSKENIWLKVSAEADAVKHIREIASLQYGNRMAYVHMEQDGKLPARTQVRVKADLTGLNAKKLRLYVYDWNSQKAVLIEKSDYRVQEEYILFFTKTAGDVIIADKALTEKPDWRERRLAGAAE